MKITYRASGDHAGFHSSGIGRVPPPELDEPHVNHVLWLVSQLEMPGGWGQIQNCYDAAVMSGGVLHHTAVLGNAQGSLWGLLRRCFSRGVGPDVVALENALKEHGWKVGVDDKLRTTGPSSAIVEASEIRRVITATTTGKIPSTGPKHDEAKWWATLFANCLADPSTHQTQVDYAAEWLLRGYAELEVILYDQLCGLSPVDAMHSHLDPEADFILAAYHAFSVNAPAIAAKYAKAAMSRLATAEFKYRGMIREMGTSDYGNWKHRADGRGRYDRTRAAALAAGIWSGVVNAIMPETP